jgi:FlaA1/EpsC-like NDP-sugar epimerase
MGTIPGDVDSRGELTLKRAPSTEPVIIEKLFSAANKFAYSRANQMLIDSGLVAATLWASYELRFDGEVPDPYGHQLLLLMPLAVSLHLSVSILSGVYKRIWRFFGLLDATALARSVALVFAIAIVWRVFEPGVLAGERVPYGILVIYSVLSFGALVGARLTRRILFERAGMPKPAQAQTAKRRRLLLAGAGEAGLYLLRELHEEFEVVGFIDDNQELQGRTIGGWRVLGTTHDLEGIVDSYHVDEVILSMPSAPRAVVQRIVARCAKLSIKTSSVPTLLEIVSGSMPIGQLRPVSMEDLLGRHSVAHPEDFEELTRTYRGARILVTGAGGSIGSELVRQLKRFEPSGLILLDKDENSLYEITCEILEEFDRVVEVVADIRNRDVMEKLFAFHRPEVVFHAAAYKHVPLMEHYPAEAVLNNVMGTRHVAELSHVFGAKTFVLISTDKAVNPSSTMGASKRVAEMLVQEMATTRTTTRFCCVRFGNVLGSRASVVPLFQRQIRQGKNITVTHPDVCRYFMTIPEAVQLVIQAGSLGKKGEIFLLDMGDPVKIVDLARNLIELYGLVPDKDVTIEFTGLRPGEKLNEELLIAGEQGIESTVYSKVFVVGALNNDWSNLRAAVKSLERAARAGDVRAIHGILESLNIGYRSPDEPSGASPQQTAAHGRRVQARRPAAMLEAATRKA